MSISPLALFLNKTMDLTIPVGDTILNIRAVVLAKARDGYLFERHLKDGYYYAVGGRVQINESSVDSAVRELKEEINIDIKAEDLKLKAMIENFFEIEKDNTTKVDGAKERVHEIGFVYSLDLGNDKHLISLIDIQLSDRIKIIKLEEMKDEDIRPTIIREIIEADSEFIHAVNRQ